MSMTAQAEWKSRLAKEGKTERKNEKNHMKAGWDGKGRDSGRYER